MALLELLEEDARRTPEQVGVLLGLSAAEAKARRPLRGGSQGPHGWPGGRRGHSGVHGPHRPGADAGGNHQRPHRGEGPAGAEPGLRRHRRAALPLRRGEGLLPHVRGLRSHAHRGGEEHPGRVPVRGGAAFDPGQRPELRHPLHPQALQDRRRHLREGAGG